MPFSKRITIERHKDSDQTGCAGLISGETEAGEKWVLFLDADGKPEVYWPQRDENGGVVGPGITLDSRVRKAAEILNSEDPLKRMREAVEAADRLQNDPEHRAEVEKALRAAGKL